MDNPDIKHKFVIAFSKGRYLHRDDKRGYNTTRNLSEAHIWEFKGRLECWVRCYGRLDIMRSIDPEWYIQPVTCTITRGEDL